MSAAAERRALCSVLAALLLLVAPLRADQDKVTRANYKQAFKYSREYLRFADHLPGDRQTGADVYEKRTSR